MCKYIDRTGNLLSKDVDKRKKSGEQHKIEKLKERKMRHEVIAGVQKVAERSKHISGV
jgi:hypothetical protein